MGIALSLMACTANDSPTESSADSPALARSAAAAYTFIDLGTLDGCCSRAAGINAKAKSWASVTTQLKGLGGSLDVARGINSTGRVVGSSSPGFGSQTFHAVLWDKSGAVTDLGTLGGDVSSATGINSKGTVVGCSGLAGGISGFHAFTWNDGKMTDLGTLRGQQSCAAGIDDAGRVVGAADVSMGIGHAVICDHGVITDLAVLAGEGASSAVAINAEGTVVGFLQPLPEAGATHAAMWIRR